MALINPDSGIKYVATNQLANEKNYGIAPKFKSDVRPLSSASSGEVVNETGVRKAVEDAKQRCPVLTGHSFSASTPDSGEVLTGIVDNDVHLKSLYFTGPMFPVVSGSSHDTIYLSTSQDGVPSGSVTYSDISLNGGIQQEITRVTFKDTSGTIDGITLLKARGEGLVIGKIIIRGNKKWTYGEDEPVSTDDCISGASLDSLNYTKFSIGLKSERDDASGFVAPFNAPYEGYFDNVLYNGFMLDKVEFTEVSSKVDYYPIFNDNFEDSTYTNNHWINNNVTFIANPAGNGQVALFDNSGDSLDHIFYTDMNITTGDNHFKFKIYPYSVNSALSCLIKDTLNTVRCGIRLNGSGNFQYLSGNTTNWINFPGNYTYTGGTWYDIDLYNLAANGFNVQVNNDINDIFPHDLNVPDFIRYIYFEGGSAGPTNSVALDYYRSYHTTKLYKRDNADISRKPICVWNDDIVLHKLTSYDDEEGEMDVIIFYDHFNIEKNKGDKVIYAGGIGTSVGDYKNSFEIFNYNNLTYSTIRGLMSIPRGVYGSGYDEDNQNCYYIGGAHNGTISIYNENTTIERLSIATYVPIYLNIFLTGTIAYRMASEYSYTHAYVINGYTNYGTSTISNAAIKLQFSNETLTSAGWWLTSLYADQSIAPNWPLRTIFYLFGGRDSSMNQKDEVAQYNNVSETYSVITTAKLKESLEGTSAVHSTDKIWIVGGASGKTSPTRTLHNTVQTYNYNTDTMDEKKIPLSTKKAYIAGNVDSSRSFGFFAGGGDIEPDFFNTIPDYYIDMIDFINDTVCVTCRSKLAINRAGFNGVVT